MAPHIAIDLPDQSVHIHAQRELAFEMVSTLGRSGGAGANGKPMSTILEQDGNRMLVEFNTPLKLGPFSTAWTSKEWVTPESPTSIDFELVPANGIVSGGLRQLTDRFEFKVTGNCTELTYKSRFGIRWSVGGWLVGKTLIRPIIKSHMAEHLGELKQMIESRAKSSHVYPQMPCDEGGP